MAEVVALVGRENIDGGLIQEHDPRTLSNRNPTTQQTVEADQMGYGHWSLHTNTSRQHLPEVIVIGAGMSGLVAARILHDTGFRVVVLEARDRLGGRIWTDRTLGVPIDLGASWIHGGMRNPLTVWCARCRIETVKYPSRRLHFLENGRIVESRHVLVKAKRMLLRLLLSYLGLSLKTKFASMLGVTYDLPMARLFDMVAGSLSSKSIDMRLLVWLGRIIEGIEGGPLHRISFSNWDPLEYFSDNRVPAGGYDQLINEVATGLDIRLNTRVVRVDYHSSRLNVVTADSALETDLIVVTLPVGVLRSEKELFDPPLPQEKRAAIERIGYGGANVVNKIVLHFSRRFWPKTCDHFALLSGKNGGSNPFVQWYDQHHHLNVSMLVGFLAGGVAAFMDQNASDKDIVDKAVSSLASHFAGVPAINSAIITRWLSDPYSRGSYSYAAYGSGGNDRDLLSLPIDDRIYFAGEATHKAHYGTVHGALLSGMREAIRIHRRFCCRECRTAQLPWCPV